MHAPNEKTGVLIEYKDGRIKAANFGMITAAHCDGKALMALVLDPMTPRCQEQLQQYGVDTIVDISTDSEEWNPDVWAHTLVAAMEHFDIKTLVGLTSPKGRDLLPRIAAILDAPLVMDCIAVDVARKMVKTTQYSGKTVATIQLTGNRMVYGVRPKAVAEVVRPVDSEKISFSANPIHPSGLEVVRVMPRESETPDLTEADIILSGGRGLINGDNFNLLFDCAAVMGAGVGASRVAVEEGWVPYSMQVGQTGVKVNPKVYLAFGISGSVQHFAGMKSSGMVIAVNTDAKAAIMSNCDYFAVADLFKVLPELKRQLEKAL